MRTHGRLTGQTALVTGGSRGIGKSIALEFLREGATVVIASRSEESLARARAELRDSIAGCDVHTIPADFSSAAECSKAAQFAISTMGKLDILVNCAAEYTAKPLLNYTSEDLDRMVKLNLQGPFFTTQAALPHMVERRYGRIINIASTAGKWGSRNQSVYNMTKHGVVALTRCAALEFAGQGVTVNAICPGIVDTDLIDGYLRSHSEINGVSAEQLLVEMKKKIPIGRLLQPNDISHFAVYLASKEAEGMTGQSILLDGGTLMV